MSPFFQWCDDTFVSQAIRNSRVAFPVIENFHLFALTVLLGSLVVLALRQFGLIYKTQPISEVASALRPWNRWSLAVMLTSGILAVFVGSDEVLRQYFVSREDAVPVRRSCCSNSPSTTAWSHRKTRSLLSAERSPLGLRCACGSA